MTRSIGLALALSIGACLGCVLPARAQLVQGAEDCKVPGGCGTSSKPGGVERGPMSGSALERAPAASDSSVETAPRTSKKRAAKMKSAPVKRNAKPGAK